MNYVFDPNSDLTVSELIGVLNGLMDEFGDVPIMVPVNSAWIGFLKYVNFCAPSKYFPAHILVAGEE